MAQLPGNGFDPSQTVDEPLLPDGEYLFEIVDSAFKEGGKQNSTYIALTCDGKKGTRAEGERIWQNFTYTNDNRAAVRMGQKSFKEICEAVGVTGPVRDTAVLHGRIFLGSVCTEKGTGGYSDKNQFTGYAPATGAAATGAPPVPPQQYAPPQQQQYAPPEVYQPAPAPQYQAPPVQQAPQAPAPAYQPEPAPRHNPQAPAGDPAPWMK